MTDGDVTAGLSGGGAGPTGGGASGAAAGSGSGAGAAASGAAAGSEGGAVASKAAAGSQGGAAASGTAAGDDALARSLAIAVLAVPGVLQTYDARHVVAAVVADAATALRAGLGAGLPVIAPAPLTASSPIAVSRGSAGLSVTVKIAVSEERPAAATCRDVYAVVADAVAALPDGGDLDTISVQISRIG
ncbi:hypothetical protein ITJ64_09440 [Herbiconiux sp. VKM Ac-1786]|uniref:hypothetical protein n=1 Tax=Herbiconiux sp. VKM Ac-1786 TaxID=2783824 RepID=UPI00188C41B6|nr:hypothetical protein [Herbiconiux sp. VKM Ac-1786]MBF4572742.1 hypothetical protein [Herbiconiux sp. VKM Ac-1786]